MPVYDYGCRQCGTRFEARHAVGAGPPACPACGGIAARVFLAAPAVHGHMARGREEAVRSLEPKARHGPGCPCCN